MLATAPIRARDQGPNLGVSFVEAVLSELHAEALSIVLIASAACSLQRNDAAMDVALLNKEAPDAGALVDLLTCAHLGEAPIDFEFDGLAEYTTALAHAEDCLAKFTTDVRHLGQLKASAVHYFAMSESWSAACKATEAILSSSFAALPVEICDSYRENVVVLRSLLRSAAAGMRPAMDENHKLVKPRLPQHRRWPRKPLMEDCQLSTGDMLAEIFIVDISAGGAGLAHVPSLDVGQPVCVILRSGRSLSGTIAWTHEGQAGIEFTKPLRPADTLLQIPASIRVV